MYVHYVKPALRRLFNNKLYSLISIVSLATAIGAGILIYGFIDYEQNFDRMHADSDAIYRLNWGVAATNSRFATFYNPVSPILYEAFPEILDFTRLGIDGHTIRVDEQEQYMTVSLVDPGYFRLFDPLSLHGDAALALEDQGAVVLTRAAAEKLFGRIDVVGATLTLDGAHDFRVGAVVENNPVNTHLTGNVFLNIGNIETLWQAPDFWTRAGYTGSDVLYHYIRLAPGTDAAALQARIETYIRDTLVTDYDQQVYLQSLRDIHFNQDLQNEMTMVDDVLGILKPQRNSTDILLFSTIAVLTLAIAALNFMNLQAVQFTKRVREIGVRRVNGSSYASLAGQLLVETALLALIAFIVSIPLCEILTPWFNSMLGLPPGLGSVLTLPLTLLFALGAVALGVVVGMYPALKTARLSPVSALRGELSGGRSPAALRSLLIVLQFTISIGLIIGSFTVSRQLDFAFSKGLGFDPGGVVKIELPTNEARQSFPVMRDEMLALNGVDSVSAGSTIPTGSLSDGTGYIPEGGSEDDLILTRQVTVREDYFETLGMPIVAGRTVSTAFSGDMRPPLSPDNTTVDGSLVLNEAAVRVAGWNSPEEAIGQRLITGFRVGNDFWMINYTVVGVVADAHFSSIRREVEPVSYQFPQFSDPDVMVVKLAGDAPGSILSTIDGIWQRHVPALSIRRSLLADDYQALYVGETRTFALFIALSTLAVLIACSGLYGLAAYVTERRTKEIGIRKVMGSTVWKIVILLSNEFSRLVLLSNVIAWPLAYLVMQGWLENFAYRIDLTPLIFIGSGFIAFCIAWVAVGGQAARAANRNPILALRYE